MAEEGPGFPFPRLRAEALRRASTRMTEPGDFSKYYPSLYKIQSFEIPQPRRVGVTSVALNREAKASPTHLENNILRCTKYSLSLINLFYPSL